MIELSDDVMQALKDLSSNGGSIDEHIEDALRAHKPIKKLLKSMGKLDVELPEELNKEAWGEWLVNRRIHGKPINSTTAKRQIKKLITRSLDDQRQILEISMDAGYQGIFPEKVRISNERAISAPPKGADKYTASCEQAERDREAISRLWSESCGAGVSDVVMDDPCIRHEVVQPVGADDRCNYWPADDQLLIVGGGNE